MNTNAVVYFYDKKTSLFYNILDFCTKNSMNFLECQNTNVLAYLANNLKIKFIVINSEIFSNKIISDFAESNKDCYIYLYSIQNETYNFNQKNIFVANDYNTLRIFLFNHIQYFFNINSLSEKETRKCYEIAHNELNKLSFKTKLIGVTYLLDIILTILTIPNSHNKYFVNIYNELAKKYNTSASNIERSIRFSIKKAFNECKDLFFEITKSNTPPSIKELVYCIVDKVLQKLDNLRS